MNADSALASSGRSIPAESNAAESSPGNPPATLTPEVFHDYELVEALDAGGMAQAYRARKVSTGKTVFLKRVSIRSADKVALDREMKIYEKLMLANPEHVLRVLDFVRDGQYVALVTEFADGGDLQSHVESSGDGCGLPVRQAKEIGLAVATSLAELHSHGIVHRDLKPQNVLALRGAWKLTDFGISKSQSREVTQKTLRGFGTPGDAAPEQFQGVEARPAADIYSLGKLLVFLLTGQTDADHVTFPDWRHVITACIQFDPKVRPAIADVLQRLNALPV